MVHTCVLWEIKVLFSFTVFHHLHSMLVMLQSHIKIAKWKGRIFACFSLGWFLCLQGLWLGWHGLQAALLPLLPLCQHLVLGQSFNLWSWNNLLVLNCLRKKSYWWTWPWLEHHCPGRSMGIPGAEPAEFGHREHLPWSLGKCCCPEVDSFGYLTWKCCGQTMLFLCELGIIEKTFHHSKMQCFVALISHVHMMCIKPQKQCSHRWKHWYFVFSFNFWKLMEWLSAFSLKKPNFAVRSLQAADLSRVKSESSSSELGPGSKGAFSQWDFQGLICTALGVNQVFWRFCQIIDWFSTQMNTFLLLFISVLPCLLQ